jgi:hypothetical protein
VRDEWIEKHAPVLYIDRKNFWLAAGRRHARAVFMIPGGSGAAVRTHGTYKRLQGMGMAASFSRGSLGYKACARQSVERAQYHSNAAFSIKAVP